MEILPLNQQYTITTSSPGKCLLSGGYLILNPKYGGTVLNTATYITTTTNFISHPHQTMNEYLLITAHSVFYNTTFTFQLTYNTSSNSIELTNTTNNNNNVYIYYSIYSAFYFFLTQLHSNEQRSLLITSLIKTNKQIHIDIQSDYRFYSYSPLNTSLTNIKTGLGSSSALISSITSSLYLFLEFTCNNKSNINLNKGNIISLKDNRIRTLITIASISANNLAQHKIGSSFDIVSSLLGSQIFYKSKTNLNILSNDDFIYNDNTINEINSYINYFDTTYINNISFLSKLNFPFKLAMISIECGSDTKILVKKVTEYAKANMTTDIFDDPLFSQLTLINNELITTFTTLSPLISHNNLKSLCKQYRNIIQQITTTTQIDIEPPILTPLLDDLLSQSSIYYAICPGAGGYDSIAVVGSGETFLTDMNECITRYSAKTQTKAYVIDVECSFEGTLFNIKK